MDARVDVDEIAALHWRYIDLRARLRQRHVPNQETKRLAAEVESLREQLLAAVPALIEMAGGNRNEALEKMDQT